MVASAKGEKEGVLGVSLTKSRIVFGVRERGREMVSGRERKSRRRGDAWIFHKEEEKKKKKRRRRRGEEEEDEEVEKRVLEMFYFNK